MRPDVNMAPELIEELEKIAKRFGSSLDGIFEHMAKWFIEKQTKFLDEMDEIPADEVWYNLFGPTYKVQMKEAEKENKRAIRENDCDQKIIAFPRK